MEQYYIYFVLWSFYKLVLCYLSNVYSVISILHYMTTEKNEWNKVDNSTNTTKTGYKIIIICYVID